MGLYSTCNGLTSRASIIYIMCAIFFIIIGVLYETGIISREKEYEKESEWIYGTIVSITILLVVILGMVLRYHFSYFREVTLGATSKSEVWFFSHVFAYFLIAFVSPGQWPFWIALGILWEWFECYTICFEKYKSIKICGGVYDIVANIAGISIAMWIHNSYKIEGLYKKNNKIRQ
jgi:hypothetical protein